MPEMILAMVSATGNAVFKQSLGLKPGKMNLAEILNIFPASAPPITAQTVRNRDIVEGIINLGMLARVVNIVEELKNGINRHESTPEKEIMRSQPITRSNFR